MLIFLVKSTQGKFANNILVSRSIFHKYSLLYFSFFRSFYLFFCLFFLMKNIFSDTHSTRRTGEWQKNPTDFRKQDYFFLALTFQIFSQASCLAFAFRSWPRSLSQLGCLQKKQYLDVLRSIEEFLIFFNDHFR